MTQPLQRVFDRLRTDSTLQRLGARRQELEALLIRVRRLLPPALAPHCVGVLPKGERLLLFADSPAWSSRLRFFGAELALALCDQGLFRTPPRVDVRVHLAAASPVPGVVERRAVRLSERTAALLEQTAAGIADRELAAALRRLGGHRREAVGRPAEKT